MHHTVSITLQESVKCQMNVNYLAWQKKVFTTKYK